MKNRIFSLVVFILSSLVSFGNGEGKASTTHLTSSTMAPTLSWDIVKAVEPGQTFKGNNVLPYSEVHSVPITISNNTSTTSTFSVMLMDNVLDGGLTGTTITDNHVGKTWVIQSSSATTSGSGIDLELEWDASDEVGTPSSYDVVAYDEQSGSWERLNGTPGSVQTSGTTKTLSISGVTEDFTTPVLLAVAPAPTTPLVLTDFSPKSGGVGTQVTITGSGFSSTASSNTVFVGNVPVTVSSASSTQLIVSIPVSANGPITVVNTSSNSVAKTALHFSSTLSASGFDINTCSFQLNSSISISGTGKVGTAWHDQRFIPIGTGDFNADGKLDFAKVNGSATAKGVDVYLNSSTGDGNFGFTLGTAISSTLTLTSLVVEDFNGDGKLDIAATDGSTISIYKNTSSGGTVSFDSPVNISTNISALRLVAGDVDGDGNIDLFYGTTYGYDIGIARNNSNAGSISFSNGVNYITGLGGTRGFGVGDVNDDGKADVYVGDEWNNGSNYGNTVQISTTTAGGTLSTPTALSVTSQMSAGMHGISSLVDVNNDGKIDLVKADGGNIKFSQNSFSSGSISSSNFATGVSVSNFGGYVYHPLDFNGDGLLDFVNFNNLGSGIKALTNKTSSSITSSGFAVNSIESTTSGYWEGIVGDFDQDGRSDIIGFVPVSTGSTLKVYESVAPPNITLTSSFSSFNACFGSPSAEQSFSVTGSDLSGDITVTAPSNWEISQTSGGTFTSSITLTQNSGVVGSTTIYIRSKNTASGSISGNLSASSSCATTVNSALSGVVNSAPNITTSTISDISFSDNSFSIPYSATTNSPDQYSVSSGTNVPGSFQNVLNAALSNTSGTLSIPFPAGTAQGTYDVNLIVTNSTTGCSSTTSNLSFNVVGPSAPGVTSPINLCQGDVASPLTATESTGYSLRWYTVSAGGTGSSTAPTPSTSSAGSTSYYVSQVDPTYSVESSREEIVVNVNAVASAPTVSATTIDYCKDDNSSALTATASQGYELQWYTSATGGTASTTAPTPSTATVGQTSYYVSQKELSTTVSVSSSTGSTLSYTSLGSGNSFGQTFQVQSATSLSKITIGTMFGYSNTVTMKLYDGVGGNLLGTSSNTIYMNGYVYNNAFDFSNQSLVLDPSLTYYIELTSTQSTYMMSLRANTYSDGSAYKNRNSYSSVDLDFTVDGQTIPSSCESPRTLITINVNALPAAPVVSDLDVCNGDVVDLSTVSTALSGHTLSWSTGGNAATTTVPNYTSSTAGQTTYSVYQTDDVTGCVSSAVTQTITVAGFPNPGTSGTLDICYGGTVTSQEMLDVINTSSTLTNTRTNSTGGTAEGFFMEVEAVNNIVINSVNVRMTNSSPSVKVYYRNGSWSSFTNSSSGWTLLDEATNVTNVSSGLTPLNLNMGLAIPAGDKVSLYVVSTTRVINYEGSVSTGQVTGSDSNLKMYSGAGKFGVFSGSEYKPRNFYGSLEYTVGTEAFNANGAWSPTLGGAGTYTYTATNSAGCQATSQVVVTEYPQVTFTGGSSVGLGDEITLSASTNPASSGAWASSNTSILTVSSAGVVSGVGLGNANVIYTDVNGCQTNHAIQVIQGTTQAPTLTSPASNLTGATTFAVTYSLPEAPLSGSVKLTFSPTDGGTPIVWTMGDATSVNFNYNVNTTPSNAAVVSGALIPYDTYDVELSYQDAYSNPAATVTNTNIQTLAPPAISYAPASYAYLTNSAIAAITPSNTGGAITSYAIVGALPSGLTFSTTTGQITGTPTALKALTTYSVTATNASGSSTTTVDIVVDNDTDGDGIPDASDVDVDGDGVPDNGTDTDGDGINNDFDDDIDGDGIPNDQDNDIDGDGIPNDEDVDVNGDGINDNGTDTDGDGVNDANDPDIDGDGIPNGSDNCPTVINTDITVQPSTQSEDICPSLTLTDLEVTAVGENLTYQWYSNSTNSNTGGSAVAGATNATFTPPSLVGPTYYYVVVSGDCGTETSAVSGALYVRDVINPTVTALTGFTVQLDANGSYTVTESDVITSKSDNCTATPVITLANNTFTCADLTATGLAVSWTATDDEGNSTTGTVPVTVVDQIAPTMAVQNVSVQMDASGNSSVTVSQVDNGTTDNCAATLSFDAAGSITTINYTASDLGANNVTLYGTDASGNQSSLAAVVTVVDQISPVVNTQNVTVYLDANGAASITTADIDNGTTDNSGVFTLSLDVTSFDCDDLGTNTVVLTATDGSGNVSNANATVTVVDNTTPVMNITNSYAQLGPDGTVTLTRTDISGTVVDNCDVTWTFSTATFDCTMLGANIITVTATDASGNAATDEIVVTIVDNSAPVVAMQSATLVLDANGVATLDTADVIDYIRENCSVSTITVSQTSFNCSDLGANVVTLLVLDSEGNSTAQTATVTVTDATAPTAVAQDITVSLDANGAASISYLDVEDGSSDNCGVDSYSIDVANFTCSDLGSNWVVLTVADASGNTDTAWAKVTVEDNLAPTALVQPVTVALDANGAATVAAADVDAGSYDNCSGVTTSIDVTSFTCADLGANTVTLTATDGAGNTTSVATTVTVVDNLAPVVATQSASLVLDANGSATLDTADVIDYIRENCSVASISLSETSFGCSDLGANTVTLTVVDSEGNSTAMNATVTVADNDAPTILTPSMVTVYSNALCQATATWTTTVMDNCSATWTSNYASGSTFGVGQHDVITTATDAAGNTTVDTMMVSVIDTVAPTFTQMPFVVSMTPGAGCGAYVTWVAPMAVDWCSNISISASVLNGSLFTSGTHTVVFTATDDNQNTRSTTLTFTVNDGVAPVVNVPATVTAVNDPGLCGANVVLPTPTATDNCGVDTVYYSVPSGSFFNVGVTAVTITAVDFDGNTDQGTFNVVVQDTEAPTFVTVPADTALGYCNNALAYAMPTAADNCGIASVSLISGIASGNTFPVGTTKNVFEVVDIHGNSDTVSFDVTVSAQIAAPVPTYGPICANDASFDLRMGDTTFVFWGDDVDDNIFNPFSAGPGNSVVYYSWTDSLGCSSTYQMNLFVEQAPDMPIVQRFTSTHLTVHKPYAQYQWYYNGSPISGATSRSLSATAGGNYKVKVWNAAGCEEMSAPFMVGTIGLDEAAMESIVLYPNPTSGAFTIDLTTINEEVSVVIYDGIGKVVYTGEAKSEKLNIDLSDKAAGMYQVVLRGEDGASLVKRVSIQK